MLFKPLPLCGAHLDRDAVIADKKDCKKYGPCGIGKLALFLNTFYIDRRFYLPYDCISRVYKRLAMSKGGFTGKGMFATMPYLVVEYDDGTGMKSKQFNFKFEQNVDLLLEELAHVQPQIKQMSAAAEKKMKKKAKEEAEAARQMPELDDSGKSLAHSLTRAQTYLEEQGTDFADKMTAAAKAKRAIDRAHPQYKWVALAILIGGIAALAFGIHSITSGGDGGAYFLLIGLAGIFIFCSARVLPTGKNNKKRVAQELASIQATAQELVDAYPGKFPVPARYAHPVVLKRMVRIVKEGRAKSAEEALEVLKTDLKALNADVQVEQWEYDEVVAIKPMFLVADYE